MKQHSVIKHSVLASAITAVLATTSVFATELFNVQPSPVYQIIKDKPLSEALTALSQRAGIVFKINISISKDVVSKTLVANDWDFAIKSLLSDYNYAIVEEAGVKTVIISGYNGSAAKPVMQQKSLKIPPANLLVIAPTLKHIPAKYKNYPVGSVIPVELPLDKMMSMNEGEPVSVDLPMGQFVATHDSTAADESGNKTWVGHFSEEGVGYRMVLSQGAAGVMGHVITPEGTFNIESDSGATYLIDTRSFQSAADAGDAVTPNTAMMNAIIQDAATQSPVISVAQLDAAVNAAKVANDAAQAMAKTYVDLNTKAAVAYNAAVTALTLAVKEANAANATYVAANAANVRSATAANKSALATATSVLNTKKAVYTAAVTALQSAAGVASKASIAANAKLAAAAKTKAAYDAAVNALALAKKAAAPTPTPTPAVKAITTVTPTPVPTAASTNAVVDLMVLYTTASTTADFAKQRIQYLVTASNQAYKDSGINMTLRLVYAEPSAYVENGGNSQALTDLSNDQGLFKGTKDKRIQYGADVVFLFRPFYKTHVSCGTAYVGFANGSAANSATGYGVISDGVAKDNVAGAASYYCGVNTFTHEIGHNLGLVHDREYSTTQGAFSYSYAWGIQGTFGTIMSYKAPIVMLFSSPKLATQCSGTPCGFDETNATQSSDQVKSVNLTVDQVAKFMPTLTTTPVIK
ncbi:MAG: M12 family metallo-peptidase [Methylococcaceae bacterium]